MTVQQKVRLVWPQASDDATKRKPGIWSDDSAFADYLGETWEEVAGFSRVEAAASVAKVFNGAPFHDIGIVERIAAYIESESECLMPIVVNETKRDYGVRLLKTMADEVREKFGDAA